MSDNNYDSDLVSIHSASEMQFIKSMFYLKNYQMFIFLLDCIKVSLYFNLDLILSGGEFWIGYNDIQNEGSYIWTDGTSGILICYI